LGKLTKRLWFKRSNGFILNRVVRESWGWKGFVVSDCDALNTMMVRGEPGGNKAFGHAYSLNGAMAAQDGAGNASFLAIYA